MTVDVVGGFEYMRKGKDPKWTLRKVYITRRDRSGPSEEWSEVLNHSGGGPSDESTGVSVRHDLR